MSNNANEMAFPVIKTDRINEYGAVHGDTYSEGGMTKREYFAGLAMQALIQGITGNKTSVQELEIIGQKHGMDNEQVIARMSCDYADALLAELEKEKP